MLEQKIDKVILHAKRVYIAGDRNIREVVKHVIQKGMGHTVTAWLVEKRPVSARSISGIPLLYMGDYVAQEGDVVLVAGMGHVKAGICRNLEANHIYHYYVMTAEDFRYVQKNVERGMNLSIEFKHLFSEALRLKVDLTKTLLLLDEEMRLLWDSVKHPDIMMGTIDQDVSMAEMAENIICLAMDYQMSMLEYVERLCKMGKEQLIFLWSAYWETTEEGELFECIKKYGYQLTDCISVDRITSEFQFPIKLIHLSRRRIDTLCTNKLCNGCGACILLCPTGALSLKKDNAGYERPVIVDDTKCIQCGKCVTNCPLYSPKKKREEPVCLAYMASDEIRNGSTSGGVFYVLADAWLSAGGIVCGAAWDRNFAVRHIMVREQQELWRLRRSKYVKSETLHVYPEIKELLESGKKVLFSGTPCQIVGLKKYLGQEFSNLLTVDILCHCAPSGDIFGKALRENYNIAMLDEVGFREKSAGWNDYNFFTNNKNGNVDVRRMEDSYLLAFVSGLLNPIHCEYCEYADVPRQGDVTIGDFWGIAYHDSVLDDGKGTSVVLLNTQKGIACRELIEKSAMRCKEVPIEWALGNRLSRYVDPPSHKNKERFYAEWRTSSINRVVKNCIEDCFDVGLIWDVKKGELWSTLEYYAMYCLMRKNGKSVLLIGDTTEFVQKFEIEPYPSYEISSIAKVAKCDKYIKMSDWAGRCNSVLCCTQEAYLDLIKNQIMHRDKKECFFYISYPSKEVLTWIETYAQAFSKCVKIIEEQEDFSVESWLASLVQSDFVVTDSFCGVCFAIIFDKDFIVLGKTGEDTERIFELLSQLGLQERLIMDYQCDLHGLQELEKIDYVLVKQKLQTICRLQMEELGGDDV